MFASSSRIDNFTNELRGRYGVVIEDSLEAVAERCAAVLITSIDGRAHLS